MKKMSDYGTATENLDRIKSMLPLSAREKELAMMQFSYKTTSWVEDDEELAEHPAFDYLFKEDKKK